MAYILQLETASTNCSVSVAENGILLGSREHNSPSFSHSEQLHLFIEEVIAQSGISIHDLDAVAVSKGPGSYTGLRIGVSSAKGLCYALGIPLISTATLRSLALQKKVREGVLIPMLDARRMEVYTAVYSADLTELEPTKALILKKDSYLDYANKGPVHLLGSGASKCRGLLDHPNFEIDDSLVPSSTTMCEEAFEKFKGKQFEDVAYFEPYYLKDFILQSGSKT
ncbi:tRNA threonylcarbamoyladenosine biosynthesis protein TsaB [Muriicola jejuensis]|uniref:tRNA (Adenosine(37)-N6)-threonylcarbamoyltransferase complex dimerization subunit type 1 TsaB n=1 Tax=Muriicola jejuensis TaxID=504488 RepID=A0A6P0U899_9FLAO|nr:tRNA (adenosine(37)-N6)-threonylcarbamoyltransferase complex dimerization subunit type 1 TsaB [Muriicola jejuensis]NER09481.1 tRNA (adenosine(37)-N6)-threonylcarbamoyltransferase complex dimerization subunit type 1 TsaB [Muriicola jejuensis]SMP08251.1 tRNA threonylcarbamoyladenosine biosynthesis protein TsaB [Muriicola jejuensis]